MPHSWRLRGNFIVAAFVASMAIPLLALGAGLSPEDQAFFDKHISDVVQFKPTKLDDPSFVKVFATPFYDVKIVTKESDGVQTSDLVVARIDDKLVSVGRPGTDTKLPDFPKMLNPKFVLKTEADAKLLEQAMDVVYPIIGDEDKKAEAIQHDGNRWILVRGKFFDDKMGYIFDVDSGGVLQSVKFALKLPKTSSSGAAPKDAGKGAK